MPIHAGMPLPRRARIPRPHPLPSVARTGRRHAASLSRTVSAGLSVAGMVGIIGVLAATAPASSGASTAPQTAGSARTPRRGGHDARRLGLDLDHHDVSARRRGPARPRGGDRRHQPRPVRRRGHPRRVRRRPPVGPAASARRRRVRRHRARRRRPRRPRHRRAPRRRPRPPRRRRRPSRHPRPRLRRPRPTAARAAADDRPRRHRASGHDPRPGTGARTETRFRAMGTTVEVVVLGGPRDLVARARHRGRRPRGQVEPLPAVERDQPAQRRGRRPGRRVADDVRRDRAGGRGVARDRGSLRPDRAPARCRPRATTATSRRCRAPAPR